MNMKKRIYNTPVTEFVELDVNVIMENTSPFGPGDSDDEFDGDWEDQATKEQQGGSWSDIWGGMQ